MYRKAAYYSWLIVLVSCVGSYLWKAREGIGIAIMAALFSFASSFMAQSVHYALRVGACCVVVLFVGACWLFRERGLSIRDLLSRVNKRIAPNDHQK